MSLMPLHDSLDGEAHNKNLLDILNYIRCVMEILKLKIQRLGVVSQVI